MGVAEIRCPWSGALIGAVPNFSEAAVDDAIRTVARSSPGRNPGLDAALGRAAQLVQDRGRDLAALISREQGKPLSEALEEVHLTLGLIESFSRAGYRLGEQVQPLSIEARIGSRFGFTRQLPVGITALLTPNTFPLLIPAKLLLASLAAGDGVILKPAAATPLSALRLLDILREAGVNLDGVACVTGPGTSTGRAICQHPLVEQISCQGSVETLRGIRQTMGAIPLCSHHGGSTVCLVAADADLDRAVTELVRQRFENAGQTAISASTVLVEAPVMAEFVERLRVATEQVKVGNPVSPDTRMGPLTDPARVLQASGIVGTLTGAGAKLVTGGMCEGAMMHPALLAEVDFRHPALWTRDGYRELLAPVILCTSIQGPIEDMAEWLDRRSHLVASLFTKDLDRAARIASDLPVFNVHVNGIPTWRDGVIFTSDSSSRLGRRQVDARVREVSILQDVVFHPL
jgi:glyceraldehyde-3-phosphate dehydrogenase (NADP+)